MPNRPATQDHKRPAAELAAEPFTFTGVDGQTYAMPPSSALTAGMVRKNRHLGELEMSFSILEELLDAETLAALDELPMPLFNATMTGWQAYIGATPGK